MRRRRKRCNPRREGGVGLGLRGDGVIGGAIEIVPLQNAAHLRGRGGPLFRRAGCKLCIERLNVVSGGRKRAKLRVSIGGWSAVGAAGAEFRRRRRRRCRLQARRLRTSRTGVRCCRRSRRERLPPRLRIMMLLAF